MRFSLTTNPIEDLASRARDEAGGYVVFEGRVRNHNEGREVHSLEYEAFDELALQTGEELLDEALRRFEILDVRCAHRTGHLQIGDVAIRVEVASAHRKAAFEACDWIVDEVKKRVPIWKKEHYVEGDSGWINCAPAPAIPAPATPAGYYARQIRLPEVGEEGQSKLAGARVLVVGAGGLGSPALLYLTAAGIGKIGIAEADRLDLSNLHRQVLYSASDVGKTKSHLAAGRLQNLNPQIEIVEHPVRATRANVGELIAGYDLVLDCTDNFHTKFLLNDACVAGGKPLIQASIYQYEGQLLAIGPNTPCLRCLWPETPTEGCVGSCAEVGVMGFVPGVFGALQAAEAIKLILGLPSPLREGNMLLLDLRSLQSQLIGLARNPECPTCGSGTVQVAPYDLEIDQVELARYCVIDIREPEEVREQPFESDQHIPSGEFDRDRLPKADRYLLVCASGDRSSELAARLWEEGDTRFYSLVGGVR